MTKNTLTKIEAEKLLEELNKTLTVKDYSDKLNELTTLINQWAYPPDRADDAVLMFSTFLQKLGSSSVQRFQEGLRHKSSNPLFDQTLKLLYQYIDLCFPMGS